MRTFTASRVPQEFHHWQQIILRTGMQRLYVPHWPMGAFVTNKRKFLSALKHGVRAMYHATFKKMLTCFQDWKGDYILPSRYVEWSKICLHSNQKERWKILCYILSRIQLICLPGALFWARFLHSFFKGLFRWHNSGALLHKGTDLTFLTTIPWTWVWFKIWIQTWIQILQIIST